MCLVVLTPIMDFQQEKFGWLISKRLSCMADIKKIVVYKSRTGFTEKYAHWIAEDLHCDAVSLEKISASQMSRYDVIIFGGGIHAGRSMGYGLLRVIYLR